MTNTRTGDTLRHIKAISFDMDGTLWDFQTTMTNSLALTLQRIKQVVSTPEAARLTVPKMIAIRDSVSCQLGGDVVGLEKIRHAAFVRALESIGHPDHQLAAELFQLYVEARYADIMPFPEVPAALTRLKTRFKLGVISNGNTHPDRLGLPNIFDFVSFATDCGYPKPDPRFFEFALAHAGLKPHEVLHVGDSLESDVAGANQSGLLSAWLNRDSTANSTAITPHLEASNLQELAILLLANHPQAPRPSIIPP